MSFIADYPGAVVMPAHATNWRTYANTPKGWVLHTPEEAADSYPSTPHYFQTPNLQASTHYFAAYDGRIFQMVQEKFSPYANGVIGKPYPRWADASYSLNSQTVNVEIEGRAASIQDTMKIGGPQWNALVKLIKNRAAVHRISLDRAHIIGHYEVANNRSDPGAKFPWAALMSALQPEEDEMAERVWCAERSRTYLVGKHGAAPVVTKEDDAIWQALYGPHTKVMTGAQLDAMAPR